MCESVVSLRALGTLTLRQMSCDFFWGYRKVTWEKQTLFRWRSSTQQQRCIISTLSFFTVCFATAQLKRHMYHSDTQMSYYKMLKGRGLPKASGTLALPLLWLQLILQVRQMRRFLQKSHPKAHLATQQAKSNQKKCSSSGFESVNQKGHTCPRVAFRVCILQGTRWNTKVWKA